VPLQDILRTRSSAAHQASTDDSKQITPADVLKAVNKTAADDRDDNDTVIKTSDRTKKTRLSLDKTVTDTDDKVMGSSSNDKVRRRRKRSSELRGDGAAGDKISAASTGAVPSLDDSSLRGKETVSVKEQRKPRRSFEVMDDTTAEARYLVDSRVSFVDKISASSTGLVKSQAGSSLRRKETVSFKEQRKPHQGFEVMNVTAAQARYPVDSHVSYGSGTTHPVGGDVSYGIEAVEDVIQRLLDNDELLDEDDQPLSTLTSHNAFAGSTFKVGRGSSAATVDSVDRRRSREVPKKSGRSPKSARHLSVHGQMPAKLPRAAEMSGRSPGSSAVNAEASSRPSDAASDTDDTLVAEASGVSSGPRIKHVCRYASIALGKPVATFPPVTSSQLQLSALPSQEKERFLVEKSPGMYSYCYRCYVILNTCVSTPTHPSPHCLVLNTVSPHAPPLSCVKYSVPPCPPLSCGRFSEK